MTGSGAACGAALKTHIGAAARELPGLNLPVVVTVDLDQYRARRGEDDETIGWRLLARAIEATPLPGGEGRSAADLLAAAEAAAGQAGVAPG